MIVAKSLVGGEAKIVGPLQLRKGLLIDDVLSHLFCVAQRFYFATPMCVPIRAGGGLIEVFFVLLMFCLHFPTEVVQIKYFPSRFRTAGINLRHR